MVSVRGYKGLERLYPRRDNCTDLNIFPQIVQLNYPHSTP